MSDTQNIIDKLKNQGIEPNLNQIKLITNLNSINLNFTEKADVFYRLKRLIDEKQMGELFKVMLIKNKKNKFNLGF